MEKSEKATTKKVVAQSKIELPDTLEIEVVGTGKSSFIKKDKVLTIHRNLAEKLIKKGSVKLKQ